MTDQQGRRIPNARIEVVNVATGYRHETQTNPQGTYALPELEPGTFAVEIAKPGFESVRFRTVRLDVGQPRTVDVLLGVAERKEQIGVSEAEFQLDRADATVGGPVEQKQIGELPINGRNWSTLTSLVPGAVDTGAGDQRTIRFAGHGLDDNNLTLDGVDATAVFNQMQREYVRLTIPLGSIEQFDVKDQTFGADVEGGTAGAQVAVVSPSGTNSFHGNIFDYFRNEAIEARTPFNGSSPNPFLLNQFGVAAGGPVARNKLFFYAAYEGLRQRQDGSQIGLVPSPQFLAQAAQASPALLPLLHAYPAGTSPASQPDVWNYAVLGRQIDNENSGMIRLDYHFSDRTTSFVRFNSDEAVQTIPTGQLIAKMHYDTKFNNGVFEVLHVFSPALINEFKFGINQDFYHAATLSTVPYTLAVSGFSSLAGRTTSDNPSKATSLLDDLSFTMGSHTLKFGLEFKRVFLNQGASNSETLTFTSIGSFLSDQMGQASYTAMLRLVRQRKNEFWAYTEDEWKVTPNLTVNAGVRYNFFNALHALNHQAVPFDFTTCGGFCPSTFSYFNPRYGDFDPRIGIAWSRRNSVIRIGAGIYHTDGQADDQNLPISNTIKRYSFNSVSFPGLSYPLDPFLAYAQNGGLGVISPRALDRHRKDDYVSAWTLSVQQTLPLKLIATVSYLGNKATNVLTTTFVNLAQPPSNLVPYPAFGVVSWRGDVGNSTFEALQVNLRRAFQNGFLISSNYMWSHSINDGSIGGGDSDTPQNSFCRSCDKANSDFDVRSVFNLSTVYDLPFGAGRKWLNSPGIIRDLLGDWELSAIATAQSGLPVNITIDRSNSSVPGLYAVSGSERPDRVAGVSLTPAGGSTPNHWINAGAFANPANGAFGDLGRNAFRAPGIAQLDLGLSKFVAITERAGIRLRGDLFNATNRAQYGAPNANFSASNFGTISTTVSPYATGRGTPRELQVSLKISF